MVLKFITIKLYHCDQVTVKQNDLKTMQNDF